MPISFDLLRTSDPDVHAAVLGEERRQREGLELIPSENYAFAEIYATNGSVFGLEVPGRETGKAAMLVRGQKPETSDAFPVSRPGT
jgi:Serine hydroxymethyltransferase